MNFYIKTLKLWFSTHRQPKEYEFYPDKVNVITGDSSTGKSSILQIIDYCMLSENSKIVEDVINENVSWYGLVFNINGKDYALARKAPKEGSASFEFFWKEFCSKLPDETPIASIGMKRGNIEERLDEISGITDRRTIYDSSKLNLHFRQLLPLSYLSEDIIATMSSYFDFNYLDERLDIDDFKSMLRYVLDSDDSSLRFLTKKLHLIDKEISREEKQMANDERNRQRYEVNFAKLKEKAIQIGLLNSVEEMHDEKELLRIIDIEIKKIKLLSRSHRKLAKIEELYQKQIKLKMEVNEFRRLQQEYNRAVKYAKMVKDCMMPMDFLINNLNSQILTDETLQLYQSLQSTFAHLKTKNLIPDRLPDDFDRDKNIKKQQLEDINAEIAKLDELSRQSVNPDILIKYLTLEQDLKALKKDEAKFKGMVNLQNLKDESIKLSNEIECLKHLINENVNKMNADIQSFYDDQDGISTSYRGCKVAFNIEKLQLELKREGNYGVIKNVGSKSNFMFLHLCFYLGLHQYISSIKGNNAVPSFLIVDQPSIPYYSGQNSKEGNELTNLDDARRLTSAFRLIDSFMNQNVCAADDKHFQIILLEHAGREYWEGKFSHFKTNYVFVEGEDFGLIPEYVR